tara:strand:- start:67 stop:261 length:195 start_codon:yes stop_codon:yes gene_type:complete
MTNFETKLLDSLGSISEKLEIIASHLTALNPEGELIQELYKLGEILDESNRIAAGEGTYEKFSE